MQGSFGICGVILAAGESSRMGTDKALLLWPPPAPDGSEPAAAPSRRTLLSAAILALEPFTRMIVVVAGRNADSISNLVATCGAYMVRNPDPTLGQFSSLQIGLHAALEHGCESAMITPVDCPPLSAESLRLLCSTFDYADTRDFWAVAPENGGKHGHPLLVNSSLISELLKAPVTSNAREILRTHASHIEYVNVPDDLSPAGMNTPEEYTAQGEHSQPLT
jgi:CTP:molybdopterin cytidylyltransferase MocA